MVGIVNENVGPTIGMLLHIWMQDICQISDT